MAWEPQKQLQGGRYTIKKVIGHGRFALTYLARDKNNHTVVIKTPNDEARNSPDFDRLQQVFVQEAFKLARCSHPHIVKAEAPFQEDGVWCIAMEYIDGVDLANRAQPILPEAQALQYIRQIGEALIEIHNHDLLHRDVKPENIMLRAGKAEAVLIDFGLARGFNHNLTMTRPEEIAGGFAPLELYSQQGTLGSYTDVYSLGATLYQFLTGEKPASAKERKLSDVRLIPPKEINPQISNEVNRAILRAMELDAKDRPQSMREWLDSLGLKTEEDDSTQVSNTKTQSNSGQRFERVSEKKSGGTSKQTLQTLQTRRIKIPTKISLTRFERWQIIIGAVAAIGALLAGIAPFLDLDSKDEPDKPKPTLNEPQNPKR
ncbi:MAG: serine/threonine protein kinase [Symploca sp. SIO2E9]|nr:serine/threonine protein kinase [Symploca sp. SIO2E9]